MTDLLDRLVLAHQTIRCLESHPRYRIKVIASAQDRHHSKFGIGPTGKVEFFTSGELGAQDFDTVAIRIELEQDGTTTKDEQIRVFRDDSVDNPYAFEVSELWISFVRCHNVLSDSNHASATVGLKMLIRAPHLNSFSYQGLSNPFGSLVSAICDIMEQQTHLYQLIRHFRRDVYTFGEAISRLRFLTFSEEGVPSG